MVQGLMRLRITINGRVYEAEVEVLEDGAASAPGTAASGEGVQPPPARAGAPTAPTTTGGSAAPSGAAAAATADHAPGSAGQQAPEGLEVRAALPGVVTEVRASVGQRVAPGDVLLVLEAMKMDNDVTAPAAGTVRSLLVAAGDQVAAHQVVAVLE